MRSHGSKKVVAILPPATPNLVVGCPSERYFLKRFIVNREEVSAEELKPEFQ
jgi:hypothetical protein